MCSFAERFLCCVQESEDAVKVLAKEKDQLEREKWDLRRQTKEATEHAGALRSQLDLKENRIKELEAELAMVSRAHTQTHTRPLAMGACLSLPLSLHYSLSLCVSLSLFVLPISQLK